MRCRPVIIVDLQPPRQTARSPWWSLVDDVSSIVIPKAIEVLAKPQAPNPLFSLVLP